MKNLFFHVLFFLLSYPLSGQNVDLTVRVEGIKKEKGLIQIGLYNNEKSFPVKGKEYTGTEKKVTSGSLVYTFKNIPGGTYAIALFHDADSNRKLNRNILGIPSEGFGFSNNIKKRGIPAFEDAKFEVTSDRTVVINLNYL